MMMDDEPRSVLPSPSEPERLAADGDCPNSKAARIARWQAENAHALAAWNDYIEANGLPLQDYQLF